MAGVASFMDIVAPRPVEVVESLTDGVVDANVNLACAVKLSAFMHRTSRMPILDLGWAPEYMLDRCGRRRSPATIPANRRGLPPGNAGKTYRPSPLSNDEVLLILASLDGDRPTDVRDRALVSLLWRTGLRIAEALALVPDDLDETNGTVTVRNGKGSKHRVVGLDPYGWELIGRWLAHRRLLPVGETTIFCVILGRTKGLPMGATGFRTKLHKMAARAGVTKRVHPHCLRHSLACELNREGLQLPYISKQLGHSNVGITSVYLAGVSNAEVVGAIAARVAPRPADLQESREEWS